jgi:ubiquinone/menaquinone biosynthesis C-methylase UbiE
MGIFKTTNYIDVYRIKARSRDIATMSDRDRNSTDFINNIMSTELKISPGDKLLDIGCGDGTFITSLSIKVDSGVGISPTEQEIIRLKSEYQLNNISFIQGLSSSIPLPDHSFDKVVCNSVLLILSSYEELEKSIKEISRVTKPAGMVFLGEIMIVDELVKARKDYGDSILKWLIFLLKNRGLKSFYDASKMLARCLFSEEPFIITPKNPLVISTDNFIALCEANRFELVKKSVHELLDSNSNPYMVPSRMNFVFLKK